MAPRSAQMSTAATGLKYEKSWKEVWLGDKGAYPIIIIISGERSISILV